MANLIVTDAHYVRFGPFWIENKSGNSRATKVLVSCLTGKVAHSTHMDSYPVYQDLTPNWPINEGTFPTILASEWIWKCQLEGLHTVARLL